MDKLILVNREHELTSMKVCTNVGLSYIRGIQVSYGVFDGSGELTNDVSLTPFGDLNQARSVCTNFYIPQGDNLGSVFYYYNINGISAITLTTVNGVTGSYGIPVENDSTFLASFS